MPGDEVRMPVAAVTGHASAVDAVADDVALGRAAAAQVQLGGEAYGTICVAPTVTYSLGMWAEHRLPRAWPTGGRPTAARAVRASCCWTSPVERYDPRRPTVHPPGT